MVIQRRVEKVDNRVVTTSMNLNKTLEWKELDSSSLDLHRGVYVSESGLAIRVEAVQLPSPCNNIHAKQIYPTQSLIGHKNITVQLGGLLNSIIIDEQMNMAALFLILGEELLFESLCP